MKVFAAEEVKKIDAYTIAHEPIASIDLMERASKALTDWYVRRIRTHRRILIFAGPGNNGGDALALARLLTERQYSVECFLISSAGKYSEDCRKNLQRLKEQGKVPVTRIKGKKDFPSTEPGDIIFDGLFGSGLSRPVEGIYKEVIRFMNDSGRKIISIDIPSGLFGEDNSNNNTDSIVQAEFTLTFQFPFLSFFFSENYKFTGDWTVLNIGLHPEIIAKTDSAFRITDRNEVRRVLPRRTRFMHKGNLGHALVIAGSHGMMGAALLAGESALRAGAGLVTLHVPEKEGPVIQTALPEVIVSLDPGNRQFSQTPSLEKYASVAVGPGLGMGKPVLNGLKSLLEKYKGPLVIDADALNLIGEEKKLLSQISKDSILTPHPLEFERIAGKSKNGFDQLNRQREFSKSHGVVVVLKGAYTTVSMPDGSVWINSTGNPGMATGGSGDVLTGIIVSLLAQGVAAGNAAVAGTYIHGLAGDIAVKESGEASLIAGDIIRSISSAFKKITQHSYLPDDRKPPR